MLKRRWFTLNGGTNDLTNGLSLAAPEYDPLELARYAVLWCVSIRYADMVRISGGGCRSPCKCHIDRSTQSCQTSINCNRTHRQRRQRNPTAQERSRKPCSFELTQNISHRFGRSRTHCGTSASGDCCTNTCGEHTFNGWTCRCHNVSVHCTGLQQVVPQSIPPRVAHAALP